MKKEKLLIISYKIPYPLSHGGAIAQFFFLKKLTSFYEISFCTIVCNQIQKENLEGLKKAVPELNIILYEQINKIVFKSILVNTLFRISNIFKNKIKPLLSKMLGKINTNTNNAIIDKNFGYADEGFIVFLSEIIKNEEYNYIQLEFFETISLLQLLPKHVKKIFIHHEIRSKRNSLINIPNSIYKNYLVETTKTLENSFLKIADRIVVFNQKDKEYLSELKSNVYISPFGIPNELIVKKSTSILFNKFIFIGGESHFPNKEGVEWFLDTIYIPNKVRISWPIYITGRWSESFVKKYEDKIHVFFTGFLPNLKEIYENSVMLTPVLSGSGIRTKIMESFANKLPVLSTKFGSEGLFDNSLTVKHIIHFESEIDFLKEFEKMQTDMNYLTTVANNGFEYFCDNFDDTELVKKRIQVYLE